jgi:hypothetical protein
VTWLRYYALLARCDSADDAADLEEQMQAEEDDDQPRMADYDEG